MNAGKLVFAQLMSVFHSKQRYPKTPRRIRFKDPDTGKTLVFLTNPFDLPTLTICQLDGLRCMGS